MSSVISEIDEDVRIVPRGAFVQVPTAEVVKNRSFEGTLPMLLLFYEVLYYFLNTHIMTCKQLNTKTHDLLNLQILFSGLSVQEAAKLCNYMHFREAKRLDLKTLLQRANMDKAIDFMDSVEDDVPRGEKKFLFSSRHRNF